MMIKGEIKELKSKINDAIEGFRKNTEFTVESIGISYADYGCGQKELVDLEILIAPQFEEDAQGVDPIEGHIDISEDGVAQFSTPIYNPEYDLWECEKL